MGRSPLCASAVAAAPSPPPPSLISSTPSSPPLHSSPPHSAPASPFRFTLRPRLSLPIHPPPPPHFDLRCSSTKLRHSPRGNSMECLTASFTARNAGREYNFVCPSKSACEKQWGHGRVLCYYTAYRSSSHCHKLAAYPVSPVVGRRSRWRLFAAGLNLENGPASSNSTASPSGQISEQLTSAEMKSLLADAERSKLLRKLSEANQHNRFLKRQSQIKDDAVVKFRSELAVLELELQALVGLAEEIANLNVPSGSRKVNGKYIQSHLLSRLEAVHDKVMVQIKDIESLRPREIAVHWVGMAENVQIMGSFDGWSHGESMSREYSGDYARFSATLRLRPGSYEMKFVVDGEWKLSSEYPVTGEGLTQNNKLVVE